MSISLLHPFDLIADFMVGLPSGHVTAEQVQITYRFAENQLKAKIMHEARSQ